MIALLLACADGSIETVGPGQPRVEQLPDVVVEEDTGPAPDATRVFNLDAVHEVDITLAAADRATLRQEPYTYVPATVSWDGQVFATVGVRLKGRLGSYRDLSNKAAFKLDFLEYGGEPLEGLEKLNLNNMVQDCAQVKELAAYAVYADAAGTPAPRVAYAWVRVNDEDYGLHSVVEDWDDVLLKRAWADASGNLYDGDYVLHGDGSYTLLDFNVATQDMMTQSEGEDVAFADVHAVTAALDAVDAGTGTFADGVGAVVDLDQFARFWAATAWIGQYDSYVYYSNNWRVYFDPADGKAELLPWDPDWAFSPDVPLLSPYGRLAAGCLADTACHESFRAALRELATTIPASGARDDIVTASALINPWLRQDTRLETDVGSIRTCQDNLLAWFDGRDAALTAALGL